jgi:hypothetical protein
MTFSRKEKEEAWIFQKKRIGTIVTLSIELYASLRVIKRSIHRKQHAAVRASYRLSLPSFTPPRIWVANVMDYVKMINERTVFLAKDRPKIGRAHV